jgi:hypothetical protein
MWSRLFVVLAFVPALVFSLAPTDEIQDAVIIITSLPIRDGTELTAGS